jgi:hypothetical protein
LIEETNVYSESFRELCDDLAEAERALAAAIQMPETLCMDRSAECEEWVESLTSEIALVLRVTRVVHVAEANRKLRR